MVRKEEQITMKALYEQIAAQGTRFIIVTGGVCSSIGKGVLLSSIGVLLKDAGYRVGVIKCDPYLNVDPGTMSPLEHGEVFVTCDGAETDLDLGHYERMLGEAFTKDSSVTAGKVYSHLIAAERDGAYLGKCITVVPHVTDEIKRRLLTFAQKGQYDVVMVEIGGTVGDIEGEIFLEALRELRHILPRGHVVHTHLSLVPYLPWANETKTKPTQHSVMMLKRAGLAPDLLFLRTVKAMAKRELKKVSVMCGVAEEAVFQVRTRSPLYTLFFDLNEQGVLHQVQEVAGLPTQRVAHLEQWQSVLDAIEAATHPVRIGMVAKYVGSNDPYISLVEALKSAGHANGLAIELVTIDSQELEEMSATEREVLLQTLDGIVIPGGFDKRGVEGKIAATKWAREHKVPFMGICLGMQVMLIEAARNLCGLKEATSTEFDVETPDPVITMIDEQHKVVRKGGTMRLGTYTCALAQGSKACEFYGSDSVDERHRHRYEFNNTYKNQLEGKGVRFSGICPQNNLVEVAEMTDHPFMIGVQFHPEYRATPLVPHPLLSAFMAQVKKKV
ncbi:MAG: synthase [Candidatus Dependentiae bacterium]|nr:synthase [Candidatus Dependentiae bacterium]